MIRALIRSPSYRAATRYTLGLWATGWVVLELLVWMTGRTTAWAMPFFSLTYLSIAAFLALGLQALVVATDGWRPGRRMALIGGAIVLLAGVDGAVDTVFNYWASQNLWPGKMSWAEGNVPDAIRAAFLYGWVYCLNAAMVMLVIADDRSRHQEANIAAARSGEQQAHLAMLRYQLNPHFLFNALNAISSLVVTRNNDRAEEMIERLSSFLRASLAIRPDALVPLDEELGIVEEYLELEAVRFGDRLEIDFACDPAARALRVPSFLLQPIVENAVKYAVAPSTRPVRIRIEARAEEEVLALTVSDDGEGDSASAGGTGIGLTNVRERLRTVYGPAARMEAGPAERGFRVAIHLPARASA